MSRRVALPVTISVGDFSYNALQIDRDALVVAVASERSVLRAYLESGAARMTGNEIDVRARFRALGRIAHILKTGTAPLHEPPADGDAAPVAWGPDGTPIAAEAGE